VHVYGARGTDARVPPDLFRELLAAPELPRRGGERRQQLELLEAQVQRLVARAGGEVLGVELEVAGLDEFAAPARLAALQVRVDAGDELLHPERLGHVVVRARLEAADLVLLGVLGRDHDDHHALIALPNPLAHLYAGLLGKHDVQKDKVGPELARHPQGLGPVVAWLTPKPVRERL
jgi:hypothetical protein